MSNKTLKNYILNLLTYQNFKIKIMTQKKLFLKLLVVFAVFLISENAISQTNIEVIDSIAQKPNRLKFGVGFGLSFVGGTNISLSPNLLYILSEKVSIGGGIQGSYSAIEDLQSTTTFGANVITQYSPIEKITTLLEFTELKVNTKTDTPTGKITDDYWDAALFIGAGYNITSKISVGAKYNVLYNEDKSVYTSPVLPFVNISF